MQEFAPALIFASVHFSVAKRSEFNIERGGQDDVRRIFQRRGSSVVERIIGNDEVGSSILPRGTSFQIYLFK